MTEPLVVSTAAACPTCGEPTVGHDMVPEGAFRVESFHEHLYRAERDRVSAQAAADVVVEPCGCRVALVDLGLRL